MLKGERGIALFMSLIIILFSALMTVIITGISIINIKLSSNIAGYKKAVYAAEAGREYARALVIKNAPEIPEVNNSIILANGSSFNINIKDSEDDINQYIVESRGEYYDNIKDFKTDIIIDND